MSRLLLLLLAVCIRCSVPQDFDSLINSNQKHYTTPDGLQAYTIELGKTINQRQFKAYAITKMNRQRQTNSMRNISDHQNAILITSYMHAREPYSVQLSYRLLFSMLNVKTHDHKLKYLLQNTVVIFFPYVNIDGYYEYRRLPKEMAIRKNNNKGTNKCPSPDLGGVDINRNFPARFGTIVTSADPCSEEYRGTGPFSQEQSRAIKSLYEQYRMLIAIDVHSFGNQWIYPYAYDDTGKLLSSHLLYPIYQQLIAKLQSQGKKVSSCIESLKYVADGVYIDWALQEGTLSFAYELGLDFSDDPMIDQEINAAMPDFNVVFEAASINYKVMQKNNSMLQIVSTSIVDFTIVLVRQEGSNETILLKSRENMLIKILPNQVEITLTVLGSDYKDTIKIQVLQAEDKMPQITPVEVSLLITSLGVCTILLCSIFCYSRWCKKIKRISSHQQVLQSDSQMD